MSAARELAPSLLGLTLDEARDRVDAAHGLSLRFAADLADIDRQKQRERTEPGYEAPFRRQGLTAELRFGRITVWTRDGVIERAVADGSPST
jgi:hypothetical protein